MNTKEIENLKRLSAKYSKKEKVIQIMYEISKEEGYNMIEFEKMLKDFYSE